nr:unnamed protein product [Callosobruchus analis]
MIENNVWRRPARCDVPTDNTPPTLWLDDRDWHIREGEQVGARIAQAHSDDAEGGPLEYGLEPILFYGHKGPPQGRLPFRIDPETGTVYLNESLKGRAGENLHLYVTVTDGQFNAKSEVNVNILSATARYNPSQPKRPPIFGSNGGFPPGLLNRPPPPPPALPPGYGGVPANGQPPSKNGQPHFQQKTYLEPDQKQKKSPVTTQLRPVLVNSSSPVTEKTLRISTTTSTAITKNVVDITDNDIGEDELMAAQHPVLSSSEIPATIIPILLSKEPSGGIVMQEDSLNMHEWRGPRAFSNRYEPWQGDSNRTQVTNQLSGTVKDSDRWEFPRHRLKFFNILGEGAFGQVWKCEALDLEGMQLADIGFRCSQSCLSIFSRDVTGERK